jgi:hypothetical protein
MIIYYSDSEEVGGSTALVPRTGSADAAYRWPLIAMPGKRFYFFCFSKNYQNYDLILQDWVEYTGMAICLKAKRLQMPSMKCVFKGE